ncbi:MAG TPA: hypothetical protein VLG66_12410 [Alphaproteobacteria bacterium]|nr:hypothetical protein [Alphaproteobacteria bacterium]
MRDRNVRDCPTIPLIDLGAAGPLQLLERELARAHALLALARRRHGRPLLRLGDRVSRAWLQRADNPYRREILAVAEILGAPGAIMLNMSFEWGCTSGAAPDPSSRGNRMMRVLDWPVEGLGRYVVVARHEAPAGPYFDITWPGAVGVLNAMAPKRFAAAINQAPMVRHGLTLAGDWTRNRIAVWRSRALPPAHLLRRVFSIAADFAAAKEMLIHTPIALPALFILSGIKTEEGCVIERLENRAFVHDGAVACANDWLSPGLHGRSRGRDNRRRRQALTQIQLAPNNHFAWLAPPILNRRTRLALTANAALGQLAILGVEHEQAATREFSLNF